ncbi:hypothetical protein [Kitasatospora sp. GAS1066B]|uniref:hypothetical protein n=1 Tax=Kitasatospora sp. GAS1066B TaxID=3156271 RepID=UPI0035125DC6
MSEQNPYGPPTPPQDGGYGQAPGFGPVPPQAPGYGPVPPQAPGYGPIPPQAPGYQQPGQPGQPWPGAYYPVTPAKRSRRGLWVTLGVVGGAIVVAATVLVFTVADKVTTATANLGTQKVVLPQTFQGLNSDPTNSVAQSLRDTMDGASTYGLTSTVGTVYHSPLSDRALVAYGGYGSIVSPSTEETSFWNGFEKGARTNGATFSARQHPSPGPQGGLLSCEDVTGKETDAVCLWVDNSSLVVVLQSTTSGKAPSLDKAAQDARDLRSTAEVPK